MQTFKKSLWTTQSLSLWLGYDSGFQRWMPFPHFSPRNHGDDIHDLMAFGRRGPLNPCWQVLPPVFVISEVLEAPGGISRSCTAIPSVLPGSLWKEVSSSGLQPPCPSESSHPSCPIVTNAGSLALYAWTLGSRDSAPLPQWTSCQAGLYLYAHWEWAGEAQPHISSIAAQTGM